LITAERDWRQLGYSAATSEIARFGGQTFGLPWQISAPVIFYNADLVRRAGGDPDRLPSTWPDIIALAKRINEASRNAGTPVQGGFFDYLANGNWTFQVLVNAAGGRMAGADGRSPAFGGAEGLAALDVIKGFGEAGMVDMTQAQSQQAFGAGSIGVYAGFNASLGGFERAAKDKFDLRVGPWPIPAANGTAPAGGRAVVIQTRDPAKQKVAWAYVKHMTSPEVQARVVREFGAVPGNEIAIQRADLLGSFFQERPNARVGVELLPKLSVWFVFPGENGIRIVDVIRNHLREVATLRREPKAVLDDMVRDVSALLPRS
jgi:multiple sugar transport system substrate-binding protein